MRVPPLRVRNQARPIAMRAFAPLLVAVLSLIPPPSLLSPAEAATPSDAVPLAQSFDGPTDLTLTTEDDVTVAATYYPTSGNTPPAVVMVPDDGGSREAWSALASELSSRGVACLALDFRGHGESEGDADASPEEFAHDIRAGVRFLREREDIDGVRVCLMGGGSGANLAAHYGIDDQLLLGLVLLSPTLEGAGVNTIDALHGFGERPVLLMASKGDAGSAGSLSVLSEKAAGSVEVFRGSGSARGVGLVDDFMARAKLLGWLDERFAGP
jgi:dienelactone hydrolase